MHRHEFYWPYFDLVDGVLMLDGANAFPEAPKFKDAAEAEAWLEKMDHRGSVRNDDSAPYNGAASWAGSVGSW